MGYSFDFVCLGAGGGPSEADLSAYLLKASDTRWEDGIVAVEAGSGIGALATILKRSRDPFHDLQEQEEIPEILAARIYSYIQTFLISHSHLDHCLGLILSSGSLPRPPPFSEGPTYRRRITGTKQVLDDLATMIFSDRIWPNLCSWSSEPSIPEFMYLYDPLPIHKASTVLDSAYRRLSSKMSILAMPVSHGICRSEHAHAPSGTYASTAFFIRHDNSGKQLLFFGDIEPDSLASNAWTKDVWRVAASLIGSPLPDGQPKLSSIFIECSWPSTRPDKELYGHLNPQHLLHEMKVLASQVVIKSTLQQPSSQSLTSDASIHTSDHTASTSPTDATKKKRRKTILGRLRHRKTGSDVTDVPKIPKTPDNSDAVLDSQQLAGVLKGIKLYVMHFKAPMQLAPGIQNGKLSQHIAGELRELVEKEGLGLEVIPMEQGMRIQI